MRHRILLLNILCLVISLSLSSLASKKLVIKKLSDFQVCVRATTAGSCYEPLRKYVKSHPEDAEKAARLGSKYFFEYVALEWFNVAIKKNESLCSDPAFHSSFLNSLGQDDEYYEMAKKTLEGPCKAQLIPVVIKDLDHSTGPGIVNAVCPFLKKEGKSHPNCENKPEPAIPKEAPAPVVIEKLPSLEKTNIKVSGLLKAFKGPEGALMSMAKLDHPQGLFLVKFENVESEWNQRVLLHQEGSSAGSDELEYWTEYKGKKWATILKKNCRGGYCIYQANLPGVSGSLEFTFDESETSKRTAAQLLKDFLRPN